MSRKLKISIAVVLFSLLILAGVILTMGSETKLAKVHQGIVHEFTGVRHIDGDGFSRINPKDVILFDVREETEFSVSRLKDSIRVDPKISREEFIKQFSDAAKGKTAIFYCSVGQRSSSLASKVQSELISSGAKTVLNLEGGIFKWHNEQRPLYTNGDKPSRYVHPYNSFWGSMVNRQEYIRY